MPESTVGVQPVSPAPVQPAILQLKLLTSAQAGDAPGAAPTMVVEQAVCLVDENGIAYRPMTEATGRRVASLLAYLCQLVAAENGTIYAPPNPNDDTGTL